MLGTAGWVPLGCCGDHAGSLGTLAVGILLRKAVVILNGHATKSDR